MVNENAALSHHLFEITQAQGIGKVPANALGDDIDRIMESFEGFSDLRHLWLLEKIRGILPSPLLNATEPKIRGILPSPLLNATEPSLG
jgi:hypothetical protein